MEDKWISVNKELPPDNETVHVAYRNYYDKQEICTDGIAYREDGNWYWTFEDEDPAVRVTITHWRKLLEPPVETEEDLIYVLSRTCKSMKILQDEVCMYFIKKKAEDIASKLYPPVTTNSDRKTLLSKEAIKRATANAYNKLTYDTLLVTLYNETIEDEVKKAGK